MNNFLKIINIIDLNEIFWIASSTKHEGVVKESGGDQSFLSC